MAPKKAPQQQQQQSSQQRGGGGAAASTRGGATATPSSTPTVQNKPSSEALVLIVASPACQWRRGYTTASSSSSIAYHANVARTCDEQLAALMTQQAQAQEQCQREGGDACTPPPPLLAMHTLSRYGRSFLASQTFAPMPIRINQTAPPADSSDPSSSSACSSSSPTAVVVKGYVAMGTSPFGGALRGSLPLVLIPEKALPSTASGASTAGPLRLDLFVPSRAEEEGTSSSTNNSTATAPSSARTVYALSLAVVNAFAVPPSSGASPYEGLVYVPPSSSTNSAGKLSGSLAASPAAVPAPRAARHADPTPAGKKAPSEEEEEAIVFDLSVVPRADITLTATAALPLAHVSASMLKPTLGGMVAVTSAAAKASTTTISITLKHSAATCSAPVGTDTLLAVDGIVKASSSSSPTTTASGGASAGASLAVVKIASDEAVHPLIAKAQMRARLREAIAAQVGGGGANVGTLQQKGKAEEPSPTAGPSHHAANNTISLPVITDMIAQCIPSDVLGATAKGTITSVLSRVLTCCLQAASFARLGLVLPKGVLLYDAPLAFGQYKPTGKTFMMAAMSRTIDALRAMGERSSSGDLPIARLAASLHTMVVDAHSCVTKEVGGTEKMIAKMLRDARQMGRNGNANAANGSNVANGTTIIFLDNLEVLAPPRNAAGAGGSGNSVTDRSLSTLLTELDGVRGSSPSMNNVILVATCRALGAVDAAVRRPGRLDMHIELKPPQADVCAAALAAPLVPIWEGIRRSDRADDGGAQRNEGQGDGDAMPLSSTITTSTGIVLDRLDKAIILPSHQSMLSELGYGDLWLRLEGGLFTIPSSVADARYVARQTVFSMVSRLTKEHPQVVFEAVGPPSEEEGGEAAAKTSSSSGLSPAEESLANWVSCIVRAMDGEGEGPGAGRMLALLKEEVGKAMKTL